MTEKKLDLLKEINNFGEILNQRLHLTNSYVICIKTLNEFYAPGESSNGFNIILNHIYENQWDLLYITLSTLLDKDPKCNSFPNFMQLCTFEDSWQKIEELAITKKILAWRHNFKAHSNKKLALDKNKCVEFYQSQQLHIVDIESFLNELLKTLNDAVGTHKSTICFDPFSDRQIKWELQKLLDFTKGSRSDTI